MLLLFLIGACSEEKLEVGIEILPDSDQLAVKADTIAVECYTYKGRPGNAFGGSANNPSFPIGEVYDEIFGLTTSDVTMVLSYNTTDHYGSDTIMNQDVALSLKLYLNTTDLPLYGEENGFSLDAYVLNNTIPDRKQTNWSVPSDLYNPADIRSLSTRHNVYVDSNIIPVVDSGYYMIVELDNELANTLMDSIYYTGGYNEIFPAMLLRSIKSSANGGALQNINLNTGNSKMVLEYSRPNEAGGQDTLYSTFDPFGFHCNYRHNHERNNPEIEAYLRDTVNQSDNFFIQGLGGTRGLVAIKELNTFKAEKNDSVGINLAELILPINQDYLKDTIKYLLPSRLTAQATYEAGEGSIPDEDFDDYYINGYLDTEIWAYRINVTEVISMFMLDRSDVLLFSILNTNVRKVSNGSTEALSTDYNIPARAILNSGHIGIDNRAYLRVIHTKVK